MADGRSGRAPRAGSPRRPTLGVAALLVVPLILGACSESEPAGAAAAAPADAGRHATAAAELRLTPGCPLGAQSLLGLNTLENCRPTGHMTPPGPLATPVQ